MKHNKALSILGMALALGLAATSAQAGPYQRLGGWVQWHPHFNPYILAGVGTQFFFGKANPDQAAPPPPPKPVVQAPPPPAPKDSDNDGIIDAKDHCPHTPSPVPVNAMGCWVLPNIHFATARHNLDAYAKANLDYVASVLKDHPGAHIALHGHTDSRGDMGFNQKLSEQRVHAAAGYLADHGVSAERMTATGHSFNMPTAENDTPLGRAMNRRVELQEARRSAPVVASAHNKPGGTLAVPPGFAFAA